MALSNQRSGTRGVDIFYNNDERYRGLRRVASENSGRFVPFTSILQNHSFYDTNFTNSLKLRGVLPRYVYDTGLPYLRNDVLPQNLAAEEKEEVEEVTMTIPSVSQHRVLFAVNKYPALVIIVLAVFILWALGWNEMEWYEKAMFLAMLALGVWTWLSVFCCVFRSENGDQKRAHKLTSVRILLLTVTIVFSLVSLVFACLNIIHLQEKENNATTNITRAIEVNSATAPQYDEGVRFKTSERIVFSAILLGLSLLMLLFSASSVCFAVYALSRLHKLKRLKRAAQRAHYDNRSITYF